MRTLTLLFFLFPFTLLAQPPNDCLGPSAQEFLHGNDIRANLMNNGGLWWDLSDGQFQVPYQGSNGPGTIFASGLNLAAFDPAGNLKVAATAYNMAQGNFEFYPGPLNPVDGTTDLNSCANWDQIWTVTGLEIEALISDFEDNGLIDQTPASNLLGWPGRGNPHFEGIHGFSLPNTDLAPFFDQNTDGVYNPYDGDYPVPDAPWEIIPSQICWTVFNDNGGLHGYLNGEPLMAEVQLTAWAYSCTAEEVLNQTVFTKYKVLNRSAEPWEDFRFAMWTDFDLGCYVDDAFGCVPELHTSYAYNLDPVDGDPGSSCPFGLTSYEGAPPVQAITFLDHPMDYHTAYYGGGFCDPPPALTAPNTVVELNHYLNGRFRDGTPLTFGGNGYLQGTFETPFLLPDLPTDPDGWSMYTSNSLFCEFRNFMTTAPASSIPPGGSFESTIAWSWHADPTGSHILNTETMYDRVATLRANFDDVNFSGCEESFEACLDDCVWPGDTNADGIADQRDLLPIGLLAGSTETNREGALFWAPWNSDAWSADFPWGENQKHSDANGDGEISDSDQDLIEIHLGLTRPDFTPSPEYPVGDELYLEPFNFPGSTGTFMGLEAGDVVVARIKLENLEQNPYGLAFGLEYDTAYLKSADLLVFEGCDLAVGPCIELADDHTLSGEIALAMTHTDQAGTLQEGDIGILRVRLKDSYPTPLPDSTTQIRFKNVWALDSDGNEVEIGATSATLTIPEIMINGLEEANLRDFSVWPNPASQRVFVSSGNIPVQSWLVLDLQGRLVQQAVLAPTFDFSFSVADLTSGVYLLQIVTEEGVGVKKLLVR
jgi:hypothetical protein